MTRPMFVRAFSLWTRATDDLPTSLAAYAHADDAVPAAGLLPSRARGRASLLTRMFAETIERVTEHDADVRGTVPMLFGSCYGEMVITGALLQMMNQGDGVVSPARFQMSVHNGAAGQISIACSNRGFSSCIAAGRDTVAACLEEADALLSTRGGDIVVALADETTSQFFATRGLLAPLAMALHLSSSGDSRSAQIQLTDGEADPVALEPPRRDSVSHPGVLENPLAVGLPLWRALIEGRDAHVRLSSEDAWPCFARITQHAAS